MKKIRLISVLLVLSMTIILGSYKPALSSNSYTIKQVSVYDAVKMIKNQKGNILVVMIYKPTCSISQRFFPDFVDLTNKYKNHIKILAFSISVGLDVLKQYLSNFSISFQPLLLIPWQSGELGRSMETVGIKVDKVFYPPVVAILDRNNQVVAQGQGVRDIRTVEAVLKELIEN